MKTFHDNAGRTWTIAISVFAVKRTKALCGVDIYGLVDKDFGPLAEFLANPIALVDVLYCLCKDEADKLGISDEDFGRAMGGDSLGQAADAFLEELTDFFPNPRTRAGLKKVIEAGRVVTDRVIDHATMILESLDLDREVQKLIVSSGKLPGSSESIPAPSPSASSP